MIHSLDKQKKLDQYYMNLAKEVAKLSYGVRAKVGSCLVTASDITVMGTNGLPKALGNELEYKEYSDGLGGGNWLVTKEEVVHSELNCVLKCAKEGVSTVGATVYVTLSPCVKCAAMLVTAGVERVVYLEAYRCKKGVDLLLKCGIMVNQLVEE